MVSLIISGELQSVRISISCHQPTVGSDRRSLALLRQLDPVNQTRWPESHHNIQSESVLSSLFYQFLKFQFSCYPVFI